MSRYLCPVLEGEVESPVSGQASACGPDGSESRAETLSRDWGWGEGEAGVISGPVRAHPTSAPLLTSALYLSFSVSVWETETIGKRNPGEDRLLIICPSVHPAGAQFCLLGMGGGGMRGSSGPGSPLLIPPASSLGHPRRGGGYRKMEDTALSLRVLMGLYGRTRLTHGGVRKRPECVREPTQILPSSGTLRVGMYSKHEDK